MSQTKKETASRRNHVKLAELSENDTDVSSNGAKNPPLPCGVSVQTFALIASEFLPLVIPRGEIEYGDEKIVRAMLKDSSSYRDVAEYTVAFLTACEEVGGSYGDFLARKAAIQNSLMRRGLPEEWFSFHDALRHIMPNVRDKNVREDRYLRYLNHSPKHRITTGSDGGVLTTKAQIEQQKESGIKSSLLFKTKAGFAVWYKESLSPKRRNAGREGAAKREANKAARKKV